MFLNGTPFIITEVTCPNPKYPVKPGDMGYLQSWMMGVYDSDGKCMDYCEGIKIISGECAGQSFINDLKYKFKVKWNTIEKFIEERDKYPDILPGMNYQTLKDFQRKCLDKYPDNDMYISVANTEEIEDREKELKAEFERLKKEYPIGTKVAINNETKFSDDDIIPAGCEGVVTDVSYHSGVIYEIKYGSHEITATSKNHPIHKV